MLSLSFWPSPWNRNVSNKYLLLERLPKDPVLWGSLVRIRFYYLLELTFQKQRKWIWAVTKDTRWTVRLFVVSNCTQPVSTPPAPCYFLGVTPRSWQSAGRYLTCLWLRVSASWSSSVLGYRRCDFEALQALTFFITLCHLTTHQTAALILVLPAWTSLQRWK